MSGLEALKAIGELKENGVKINTTEEYKIVETELKEDKAELIAEQHRLFDLAKEQENELKELKEFVRIMRKNMIMTDHTIVCKAEFELVKKVMKDYD